VTTTPNIFFAPPSTMLDHSFFAELLWGVSLPGMYIFPPLFNYGAFSYMILGECTFRFCFV